MMQAHTATIDIAPGVASKDASMITRECIQTFTLFQELHFMTSSAHSRGYQGTVPSYTLYCTREIHYTR